MGLESISEPDIDLPEDDDDDDDEFSDAQDHEDNERSRSNSPVTSLPSSSSKAEEGDTEDDPVDPVTPGAGKSSFVNILPPMLQKSVSTSTTESASSGIDSVSFDDEDEVEWVGHDMDVMTPQQEYYASAAAFDASLTESQATISPRSSQSGLGGTEHTKQKRKPGKKKHSKTAPPQQYPFPATADDDDASGPPRRIPQMRTAKARDGGRTQSGGVRGVPADDLDDL